MEFVDCPQIRTVATLTCLFRDIFSESDFCTITSHFVNPISKMFCNFPLQLNMTQPRLFSPFGAKSEGKNILAKNKIRFDL